MKVLILSLGRTGSLPIYGEKIAESLENLDYEILVSKNRLDVNPNLSNVIKIRTYSSKIIFILNTLFYLPFKIISFIPRVYREYGVLYLPYQHFWDIPFMILFKLLNRRVILTVHDGILHSGERNFITQLISDFRLTLATDLIFLTDYVRQKVLERINLTQKTFIIPHPILENDYVKFHPKNNSTKNILFLGRIDKYKGVEMLMRSAIETEEYFDKLIVAGKSQYSINYIKHSKIEVIDKYLTDNEIGDLLSWANILVLPYIEASQSGVITLGIYSELPMICTRVGGFSEQLDEDEAFWCDPDVSSLGRSIKIALEDETKRFQIIEKLKRKKKLLSWKASSNGVRDIILYN